MMKYIFRVGPAVPVILFLLFQLVIANRSFAQLKFVIEDFEGLSDGTTDLKANGIFTFGNVKANIDYQSGAHPAYSGERFLRLYKAGEEKLGGWGKGINLNVELDQNKDYLNFYEYEPVSNGNDTIKIELQDDDNDDNTFEKDKDDSWTEELVTGNKNSWNLISIPLNKFSDSNPGGDGIFNINYKQGRLLCFIITFKNLDRLKPDQTWSLDFICFSEGKLPIGNEAFSSLASPTDNYCSLGIWSKEGNVGNFSDIATGFENNLKYGSEKKLGVIHFFQPFSVDGSTNKNNYPPIERINKVIHDGYIPMITLEDHFPGAASNVKQPNLYSIIEGHFDTFFAAWAKQIKQVKGTVLLRILHEFNGDWYPWCIANNDKDPQLLVKAYKRIHDIFKAQQVTNVKFIWCPNSMSTPQEKWNFIMDAYPGDEYVDFVGLDIYNGAGKELPVWRSFRKEGIENYFILTKRLPNKPLLICETASRERKENESGSAQDKAEWIRQMSVAISTDMSKIKLLTWFNEKETFKLNSSPGAQGAYLDFILKNDYFRSGTGYLSPLLKY